MKNTWKLAFAAFAMFAFTACGGSEENTTTESESMDTTDQMETTDQLENDTDMNATDTTVLEDTTVNDGVVDDISEEQPPVE